MAIYGIGASYGDEDVSRRFLESGLACVGWSRAEAPSLHAVLSHVKPGDVFYIKSFPPQVGLIIKAVGMVVGDAVTECPGLGWGVEVRWVWSGDERLGRLDDKYPIRRLTLYEEYDFRVQSRVIQLLLDRA